MANLQHEKKHKCIVCGEEEITVSWVEHTYEGDYSDTANFDMSTYSGYKVKGGAILSNGKGAMGDGCQAKEDIKKLINLGILDFQPRT